MELRRWWTAVRDSLWLVPAIWVVLSVALAFGMITLDRITPDFAVRYPLVFGGGAEGARGLLSSIAGSMITVAGVTFSITVVALQLAASQFSPRVLRAFMRDRRSQVVLGSFIGAFTYAILVLRSIRSEREDAAAFVPSLAVSVGILYALVTLGMLVFFLHHIATRIQVSTVVGNIARETTGQIRSTWPDDEAGEPEEDAADDELPSDEPGTIRARMNGYLQLIDHAGLLRLAERYRLVIRFELSPGEWVQEHAPLFRVWPAAAADEELAERLNDLVSVGAQRSTEQDAAFGIRQLVDIGVRALSPGVNDPTSASDCINRIGEILVAAAVRRRPPRRRHDDDGALRVVVPYPSWDQLLDLGFDQLRQYGATSPDVAISMARTLATIRSAVPQRRHEAIRRQARLIGEAARGVEIEADRRRVLAAVDAVLREP